MICHYIAKGVNNYRPMVYIIIRFNILNNVTRVRNDTERLTKIWHN